VKALVVYLLVTFAAGAQTTEAPHQILEKIKAIGLSLKTRDQVEPMLENAVAGWEQHDPRSPEYAQTLTMLGMIRQSRADLDLTQLRNNVEPLYRKALAVYARSFATADDADVALTCELQAWVLGTIGEVMDATPLRERGETIRKARVREMQEGARRIGAAYKVGNGISAPVPTHRVEPDFPELARFLKQQGTVKLRCVVDANGIPQDISLTSSLGFGLDEHAVRALRAWRFRPGQDGNGQDVAVILEVEMNFRIM
jgi:TonB family protein